MTRPLHDVDRTLAVLQEQRGEGMAEIIEADLFSPAYAWFMRAVSHTGTTGLTKIGGL
jgi:hypothetical protein